MGDEIRELQTIVNALVRPIERIDPVRFARAPETAAEALGRSIARAAQRVRDRYGDERLRELAVFSLEKLIATPRSEILARTHEHRAQLERDPVISAHLALLDAAAEQVSNAPLVVVRDPRLYGLTTLGALGELQLAARLQREARAVQALRAAASVAERVLRPSAQVFWVLWKFAEGEFPKHPGPFAQVVRQLHEGLPGPIEEDAARLRNAFAHGHQRYDSGTRRMVLWDNDDWRADYTADDLLRRGYWHLWFGGGALFKAVGWHLSRILLEPMLDVAPIMRDLVVRRLPGDEAGQLAQYIDERFTAEYRKVPESAFALFGTFDQPCPEPEALPASP